MDNAELIKALQNCANVNYEYRADGASCAKCPYKEASYCKRTMILDAADALEAADKRIAELEAEMKRKDKEFEKMASDATDFEADLRERIAKLEKDIIYWQTYAAEIER